MSYMLCYGLSPGSSGVIGHRLEKAADSFLVLCRDTPELINQFLFYSAKQLPKRRGAPSGEHISCVDTVFFKRSHISKIERIRSQLIVFLSPPANAKQHSKLSLI